ncbi:MAG: mevalonate kinase [Neolewinella sp.]|jgi:mevalonate kinase
MPREYPAKILLYGEHTVLRSGRGLAVPYPGLSLRWSRSTPDEQLLRFCDYLKIAIPEDVLETGLLEDHLLADWRLTGNIPTGYGLGSSGAVCAAIWSRFATDKGKALSTEDLRNMLARMEQHFHGQSSGTDPLICYLKQPVLLGGGQAPSTTKLPANWDEGFFLLDTGIERKASDFIRSFTFRYDSDAGFAQAINKEWTTNADAAIDALLAGNRKALWEFTARIAEFQIRKFPDFIPAHLHGKWTGKGYLLKLCGAGGGGMMLGLGTDRKLVEEQLGKVHWI